VISHCYYVCMVCVYVCLCYSGAVSEIGIILRISAAHGVRIVISISIQEGSMPYDLGCACVCVRGRRWVI
jgi:hypothetical protein